MVTRAELTHRANRLFAAVVGLTGCTMYTAPCAQGGASKPYQNNKVAMIQMPYPSNRETHSYSSVIMLQVDMLSRRRLWMHTFSNTPTQTRAADG